jgi:hypothetical protein
VQFCSAKNKESIVEKDLAKKILNQARAQLAEADEETREEDEREERRSKFEPLDNFSDEEDPNVVEQEYMEELVRASQQFSFAHSPFWISPFFFFFCNCAS